MGISLTDAYRLLKVDPKTHTFKQGQTSFRKLAKKYHPDKGGDELLFKKLNNAWELVKDKLPETIERKEKPKKKVSRKIEGKPEFYYSVKTGYMRWISIKYLNNICGYPFKIWVNYKLKNGFLVYNEKAIHAYVIPDNEKRFNVNDVIIRQRSRGIQELSIIQRSKNVFEREFV